MILDHCQGRGDLFQILKALVHVRPFQVALICLLEISASVLTLDGLYRYT